jgi:hypothetical protein
VKRIRDVVHDYVEVPQDYCARVVDTPLFQRLRRVRQSSLEPLCPCAVHTRFSHSLGVFHLGRLAASVLQGTYEDREDVEVPESIPKTFELACLLHDIGHAPFSHVFENHYVHQDGGASLLRSLNEAVKEPGFKDDLELVAPPAPHELVSALVAITQYGDTLRDLGADLPLLARMITGSEYRQERPKDYSLRNAFINLLNGTAIDVDKIDYVVRDTHAAGVSNTEIDVRRLISSLRWNPESPNGLAFDKSALPAVKNVVDGRNFLYLWLYPHHKVVFDTHLLRQAIEEIEAVFAADYGVPAFSHELFSLKCLTEAVDVGPFRFCRPCDADIVYLLEHFSSRSGAAKCWLERRHMLPLWKSIVEFRRFFGKRPDAIAALLAKARTARSKGEEILRHELSGKVQPDHIVLCEWNVKMVQIDEAAVMLDFGDGKKPEPYSDYFPPDQVAIQLPALFFYVYVAPDAAAYKDDMIKKLQDLMLPG